MKIEMTWRYLFHCVNKYQFVHSSRTHRCWLITNLSIIIKNCLSASGGDPFPNRNSKEIAIFPNPYQPTFSFRCNTSRRTRSLIQFIPMKYPRRSPPYRHHRHRYTDEVRHKNDCVDLFIYWKYGAEAEFSSFSPHRFRFPYGVLRDETDAVSHKDSPRAGTWPWLPCPDAKLCTHYSRPVSPPPLPSYFLWRCCVWHRPFAIRCSNSFESMSAGQALVWNVCTKWTVRHINVWKYARCGRMWIVVEAPEGVRGCGQLHSRRV